MSTEKQRKTFLSYSRVNTDFAKKLARELKAEGFNVWMDQLDIPLGARWDVELEKALEEAEIFMIIMTPDSIASENVRDEIGYAIDNGKRFLPIMLETCNVPLRLRRFQYVDFSTKSFEDGVESAKRLLRGLIEQDTIPRKEVPDDTQSRNAQTEADRKAKKDVERIAKRSAEGALAAKAETERKEKDEAERLAAKKTEADKLAKQKAEDERIAKTKAEADRKAKEEADRLAAQKAVPVGAISASATGQNKPMSKGLIYGVIGVAVIAVFGIGYGIVSSLGSSPATEAKVIEAPAATEEPKVDAPSRTPDIVPTNTARIVPTSTTRPAASETSLPTEIEVNNFTPQGTWTKLTNCPGNRNPCWADNPSGQYVNNMFYTITSPEIFIPSNWGSPYLIYWQRYNTEGSYDYLEVTINDQRIRANSGTKDWHQIAIALESFKGQDIVIRFLIATDYSIVGEGWFLHDIKIVPNASSTQLNSATVVEP